MRLPGRPTSIRLFLTDGTPDGIQIVEKSNRNGRALVANRAQLRAAYARPELELPGVYVLTGTSDGGAARLYVGERDVQHIVDDDAGSDAIQACTADLDRNGLVEFEDLLTVLNAWGTCD